MVYTPRMAQKEPREAPVSFRPGKLRAALRQRALRTATEGQIAKRDLARYYLLLGSVLLDDRLTRWEASWIARASFAKSVDDYMSGDPFLPEYIDPSRELQSIVDHAMRRDASDVALRVQCKVAAMTQLEKAALMDAVDRLPSEQEEEVGDPGHWALIGVRLADEPVAVTEPQESA